MNHKWDHRLVLLLASATFLFGSCNRPSPTTLPSSALPIAPMSSHMPSTGWPVEPTDQAHPIGNSAGEYMLGAVFHKGIDIVVDEPEGNGPSVYVTKGGLVRYTSAVLAGAIYTELEVFMTDSNSTSYVYKHLAHNWVPQSVILASINGTELPDNTLVGKVARWPSCDFHHLHYEVYDATGQDDPILTLEPRIDTDMPQINEIKLTRDGTSSMFPAGTSGIVISGTVDIVIDAYDQQFTTPTQSHKTGIMMAGYNIYATHTSGPPTQVVTGTVLNLASIPDDDMAELIYRNDGVMISGGDDCADQTYHYVLTNVSIGGDGEPDYDESYSWDTRNHANGSYIIQVTVMDASMNTATATQQVDIQN